MGIDHIGEDLAEDFHWGRVDRGRWVYPTGAIRGRRDDNSMRSLPVVTLQRIHVSRQGTTVRYRPTSDEKGVGGVQPTRKRAFK